MNKSPFPEPAPSLKSQIEAAQSGEIVQIEVTTRRQKGTTDSFRVWRPDHLEEVIQGWDGLVLFFGSLGIADTICYLTYVRAQMFPDKQEEWKCYARGCVVHRVPTPGGKAEELKPQDLLPPLPGHAHQPPGRNRSQARAEVLALQR